MRGAFRRPVEGRKPAVAILSRFAQLAPGAKVTTLFINGAVAARIQLPGQFDAVVTFALRTAKSLASTRSSIRISSVAWKR